MPKHYGKEEKAKDLKGTLLRIFKSLNTWKYILVLSCILAFAGSILSTIAPNRLAKVTDVISDSIKPNTKNLEMLNKEIQENIKNKKNVSIYIDNVEITADDQTKYLVLMKDVNKDTSQEELIKVFKKCPESIKEILDTKMDTKALKERTKDDVNFVLDFLLKNKILNEEGKLLEPYKKAFYVDDSNKKKATSKTKKKN